MESTQKLDMKQMTEHLGESKLSFASPEKLLAVLGLTPGSVSPFGLINDAAKQVTVVIQRSLYGYDKLHFHPNDNTATLESRRTASRGSSSRARIRSSVSGEQPTAGGNAVRQTPRPLPRTSRPRVESRCGAVV